MQHTHHITSRSHKYWWEKDLTLDIGILVYSSWYWAYVMIQCLQKAETKRRKHLFQAFLGLNEGSVDVKVSFHHLAKGTRSFGVHTVTELSFPYVVLLPEEDTGLHQITEAFDLPLFLLKDYGTVWVDLGFVPSTVCKFFVILMWTTDKHHFTHRRW